MHSHGGFMWSSVTTIAVTPILSWLIEGDVGNVVNHKMPAAPKSCSGQHCGSIEQKSCLVKMLKKKNVKKPVYQKSPHKKLLRLCIQLGD